MKLSLFVMLGAMALADSFVSAGVVTMSNQNLGSAGDILIVDADGIVISDGIATGGYFTLGYDVNAGLAMATTTGDFTDFLSNYNILLSDSISASGGAGFDGFYFASVNYGAPTTNPYVGASLYSILGNAINLGSSTQFAVLMSSDTVDLDSPTLDDNLILLATSGGNTSTLLGTAGTSNFDFGSGSQSTPSLALVRSVPEPSALLLSAFGALALLRRKR